MYNASDLAFQAFGHSLLALAVGAAIMVLATLIVERFASRAAVRRALWQATLVGLCVLLVFELTGTTRGLSSLLASSDRAATSKVVIETPLADVDDFQQPESAESDPSRSFVGHDLPVISNSHVPTFFPNNDDLACFGPLFFAIEEDACLPEIPFQTEYYQPQALEDDSSVALSATAPPVSPQFQPKQTSHRADVTIGILILFWLAGTCFFCARAFLARARLNRLRRRWQPNNNIELENLIESLRQRIEMKQTARIRTTEGLTAPVAFGILKPTVLVPTDFTRRFSATQQQVILAHELAHLTGNDPAWLLASELITALVWWHPLVHAARRRLLAASEQTADEASTLVPDGPDVLAECLVKLGRRLTAKPRFGWVATEGSGLRSGLARRVQRLLNLRDRPAPHATKRVPVASRPLAVVLLMVLTISCTLWVHPKASLAKGDDTMNVLRGSWRQSLAAVALTAFLGPLTTDAAAEESPNRPPKPAQLEDGSPVDQLLLADRGEHVRGDREMRERREHNPERGKRDARGPRERGEREIGHREREGRERAEREHEEHRERMMAELEELRQRAEELEHEKAELRRDATERARELGEEIRRIQKEHSEIARHIPELEREIAELKKKLAAATEDEKDKEEEELEEEIDKLVEKLKEARVARKELTEKEAESVQESRDHQANARRRMAELERESTEIRTHLTRTEAALRENPERAEIMKRIGELDREIAELRRAGRHEQAERLQVEMAELHARLEGPPDRVHREGMERLEAMERELRGLRESGRHERSEQLEREMHELRRRLQAPREGDRPGPPPELQARLEHLHAAMENLRAAGLHEQAEQIARQIEELTREHTPGPPVGRDPHMQPPGPRPEPHGEIVDQLRGQIEQLRRENEEMRRMMQELREAQERFMNELRERR